MTINPDLLTAYRYHRQQGYKPLKAKFFAAVDIEKNKKRYSDSTFYGSKINPPFLSRSTMLRWIEEPTAIGLRLVGFADECDVQSIRHKGWYCDEFQDETLRGVVYQLPTRNGIERYVYGYADPDNAGAAALCFDPCDDKSDAAHWADSIAEHAAEDQREYNEAWQARQLYEDIAADIKTARQASLALIRETKSKQVALYGATAIQVALRNTIEFYLVNIREARGKRNELASSYSNCDGWKDF